jgi:hypothetical protein
MQATRASPEARSEKKKSRISRFKRSGGKRSKNSVGRWLRVYIYPRRNWLLISRWVRAVCVCVLRHFSEARKHSMRPHMYGCDLWMRVTCVCMCLCAHVCVCVRTISVRVYVTHTTPNTNRQSQLYVRDTRIYAHTCILVYTCCFHGCDILYVRGWAPSCQLRQCASTALP